VKRLKLPPLVLARAKTVAKRPSVAPPAAPARKTTKDKVIAALKKLHPMD
jgi:hypothetical protein